MTAGLAAAHAAAQRGLPAPVFVPTTTAAIAVRRLRELGCDVALDDFGRGLSSFANLKNLPLDYLKIDGSFIRNIANSPIDEEIVMSTVRVARRLNLRTVAEHVHSQGVFDRLREIGVDYLQGRLIASPVPIETLEIPGTRKKPVFLGEEVATTVAAPSVTYDHGKWEDRRGIGRSRQREAGPAPRSPIASR
jgi:predicted signal transduction protein with EAL and GGDEF domain